MQQLRQPKQATIKTISLQTFDLWSLPTGLYYYYYYYTIIIILLLLLLLLFSFISLLALGHPETKLTLSENWRELSLVDSLPSVFLPRTVARWN